MDDLFGKVTGYLGWSPKLALHTPIPQIELALAARFDFVRLSNPFIGGEATPDEKVPKAPKTDEEIVAMIRAHPRFKKSTEKP